MAQDWIYRPEPQPWQLPRTIAGLIATSGDQPPRKPALALALLLCIQAWVPPDPQPVQRPLNVAPLATIVYGSQPTPRLDVNSRVIRAAWEPGPWDVQSERPVAALAGTVLVPAQPVPPPVNAGIIRAAWDVPVWGAQSEAPVAATLFLGGDQPPRWSVAQSATLRSLWEPAPWPAQSEAPIAGIVFVPAVVDAPPPTSIAQAMALRALWEMPPWGAQTQAPAALIPDGPTPVPPTPSTGGGGGGGGGGYYGKPSWGHKRFDRHVGDWIDATVREMYVDLKEAPKAIQVEAAKVVRPFIAKKSIDWAALEQEAHAVEELIALWSRYQRSLDDDDDMLMMET